MTPKEKAEELKEQFDGHTYYALIAVNEILKEIDNTTLSFVQTEYWQEVKEEIIKL